MSRQALYREDIPYEVVGRTHPTPEQRRGYWRCAAALQETDGLRVSAYAESMADEYVAGRIDATGLERAVGRPYEGQEGGRQEEADVVAARITGLLDAAPPLALRPSSLMGLHAALFSGVLPEAWVGRPRTENITKPEPVLGGRSVDYLDFRMIKAALDYDFGEEASRPYAKPLDKPQMHRLAGFISGVWQIHAFREGNKRTIATFSALYLAKLGVKVTNEPFVEHSVFFRDALVRAGFSSIELGVEENHGFIDAFFENVALAEGNDLDAMDLDLHGVRTPGSDVPYRGGAPRVGGVRLGHGEYDVGGASGGGDVR